MDPPSFIVFDMLQCFKRILPSVESLWSSLHDEEYFVGGGTAGFLWHLKTRLPPWILKFINYSQARSSVPPKIPFIHYLKVESVGSCRFQIHLCILACAMSCEFTCNSVAKFLPAQFPWIWCKCLLINLIHSKIFNLTKYWEVLVKYSLLIAHAGMLIWIWQ